MSEVLTKSDYDKILPIILYLEENEEISPKEAENVTGRSSATVRRYLRILSEAGVIAPEGNITNIKYRLI